MRAPVLGLMLGLLSCGSESPTAATDVTLNEPFQIKVGETAHILGADVFITLDGVADDSRCPKDVTCIWEGQATVRVSAARASETRSSLELRTRPESARTARFQQYTVRLTTLAPEPRSNTPIEQKDYVATLVVEETP
jgi:hypothetical protein